MKTTLLLIAFTLILSGLFAQAKNDSVFTESGIVLITATGNIYGTLTVPKNILSSPLVLIIAGSGPTDRDCNSPMGIQTNAYKMLAGSFAEKGISSLRFDKRGIGESRPAMSSEGELRFETYIIDVLDWISKLSSDKRFSKVIILGHSEGSLIGMLAVGQSNAAAFISVAGAGKSADKILQEQLKTKLPLPLLIASNKILDSLRAGKTVADVDPSLVSLYRPSVQPYMISWIKYNPAAEISKLKIPVLIVQGTTDLQVSVEDAKLLSAAKPDAKLLIIENMNHVLKESDADTKTNMATYRNPELPLKPGFADELISFVTSLK